MITVSCSISSFGGDRYNLHPMSSLQFPEGSDWESIESVSFAPDGTLFALESHSRTIIHADTTGKILSFGGGYGSGQSTFQEPSDILVNGFDLMVSDRSEGKIQIFDLRLNPQGELSSSGEYERPISLGRMINGDILVLDEDRLELIRIGATTGEAHSLIEYGELPQPFIQPVKLQISDSGEIILGDRGNGSIYHFDEYGSLFHTINREGEDQTINGLAWYEGRILIASENGLILISTLGEVHGSWSTEELGTNPLDVGVFHKTIAVSGIDGIFFFRLAEE